MSNGDPPPIRVEVEEESLTQWLGRIVDEGIENFLISFIEAMCCCSCLGGCLVGVALVVGLLMAIIRIVS